MKSRIILRGRKLPNRTPSVNLKACIYKGFWALSVYFANPCKTR